MDDPKWLTLVTIGLVLAALAVGYFLLTGRLVSRSVTKPGTKINQATASPSPKSTFVIGQNNQAVSTPTPSSAYGRIVQRTQTATPVAQALPSTGFPVGLAVVFAASAVISGWGLRKFPQ